MSIGQARIIPSRMIPPVKARPDHRIMAELSALAGANESIDQLSRHLFLRLRKCGKSDDLAAFLLGIQMEAFKGGGEGARLLAAYLDVTTARARLIPFVKDFSNTRRLYIILRCDTRNMDAMGKSWVERARRLMGRAATFLAEGQDSTPEEMTPSIDHLRGALERILAGIMGGAEIAAEHRTLLVEILRLETEAWQERVSRLAGLVNPYRAAAVSRVLPMLSRADTSIRDMSQLIDWVEEGHDQYAFTRNGFRALEVIEAEEFQAIYRCLKEDPRLKALSELHRGGRDNPLTMARLGRAVARLMTLEDRLHRLGWADGPLNLVSAVAVVQQFARGRTVAIPLAPDQEALLQEALGRELEDTGETTGPSTWGLGGVRLEGGQLVVDLEDEGQDPLVWPHGLPTAEDGEPGRLAGPARPVPETEDPEEPPSQAEVDKSNAVIKQLVMSNITSTSTTLGFLRNPRICAIPGLVASVAARTRNPQIVEVIATDRTLHTGFANRDVPLVCLRSPCNVSPKILRKFVHVKFVSKVDLKRMAQDKAGIRKEILREINRYLDSLS